MRILLLIGVLMCVGCSDYDRSIEHVKEAKAIYEIDIVDALDAGCMVDAEPNDTSSDAPAMQSPCAEPEEPDAGCVDDAGPVDLNSGLPATSCAVP